MIREIRRLDKVDHSKANYVRMLQTRGILKRVLSDNGYMAYDTEELKHYQKTARRGRPVKMEVIIGGK